MSTKKERTIPNPKPEPNIPILSLSAAEIAFIQRYLPLGYSLQIPGWFQKVLKERRKA
jgi:hypothetical protein